MIQTINLPNYSSINLLQQTSLTADVAAGQSSLPVVNTESFVAGFGIIGAPGAETTELVTISAIASVTSLTLSSNTTLAHLEYDSVYQLFGDKIRVYRASNVDGSQPSDDDFSLLATVDISPDQSFTQYTDSDGGSDYWYKFVYYNSLTADSTSLSDGKAVRGGGTGDYCSIDAIREEAGFMHAPYITPQMIDAKRQAAQDEINGVLSGLYTLPLARPVNDFISDICRRLAAGLLLLQQYGTIGTQRNTDGQNKVNGARSDLERLATKEVVLTDETGTSTALPGGSGGASSWPNADTANSPASVGGAPRQFRMSDISGYDTRKY